MPRYCGVRPELAGLATASGTADLLALRGGIDWNVPGTAQRVNVLAEGAWHAVTGDTALIVDAAPGFEARVMLRVSATRHNRR